MERIYAVILASGISQRLGINKLTLKIDGQSVISRSVAPFLFDRVERVFVVTGTGAHGQRLQKEFEWSSQIECVENPHYIEGMSSSVRAVIPHIKGADGVFFHLGDKPFITRNMVCSMLDCYARKESNIIVPLYKGEKGHPVLMNINPYCEEMKYLEGDKGLREIIEKYREDVVFLEGDEGSVFDIDTNEDITILKKRRYIIEEG